MVQAGLAVAFSKAKELLRRSAPLTLSMQTGIQWNAEQQLFSLESLGQKYTISYFDGNVQKIDGSRAIPKFALLTLHYLLSKPIPPTGTWISFKELPGGTLYQVPFEGRSVGRIFRKLGNGDLKDLLQACEKLKGNRIPGGDMAFEFSLFPYVPLGFVSWAGDDEFPSSGNILFDANANSFLTTEDYAVLGEYFAEQLIAHLPGSSRKEHCL